MAAATVRRAVLADKRVLTYREFGKPDGFPVLFFHGNLNSSLFQAAWDDTDAVTTAANARVIAVDRPGVGGSSPHPSRTYRSWAADARQLVQALGVSRYSVLGYSSGGPHALACARWHDHGLVCCALVSSDGPYSEIRKLRPDDPQVPQAINAAGALSLGKHVHAGLAAAYEKLRPGRRELALEDLAHAVAQGLEGPATDSVLERGEWDFAVRDVSKPVLLWHGDKDHEVPVFVAEYLRDELPNIVDGAQIVAGESHSMIRRVWGKVLDRLVKESEARAARL